MPPEIRPFRLQDLGDVTTIWEAATRAGHPFLSDAFLADERENLTDIYLPSAETWVADQAGAVGFVSLIGDEIGGLFVLPAHHGQGIGRALVDLSIARRGAVTVEVFERNLAARGFYRRYGFRRYGSRRHEETGETLLQLAYPAP